MNIQELFYRRDTITESIDFEYDYGIICEGFGGTIKETFSKIGKAIIDFFNNLIQKVKDFFKRPGKVKKVNNPEEVKEKLENSNKKVSKELYIPNSLSEALKIQEFITGEIPDIGNKYSNLEFKEFKKQVLNEIGINKIEDIDVLVRDAFFTGKKTTKVSDFNIDDLVEYINEYKDLLTSLEKEKIEILGHFKYSKEHVMVNELQKKLDDHDNKLTADEIKKEAEKYRFIYELQFKGASASVNYFIQAYKIAETIVSSAM